MVQFLFTFFLFAIAVVVVIGQTRKRPMWRWISAYWVVLAVKILIDLLGVI